MELKTGNRYLVTERFASNEILELTVLEVTQTAYNIKWGNGCEVWKDRKKFDDKYKIKEDLGNPSLSALLQGL